MNYYDSLACKLYCENCGTRYHRCCSVSLEIGFLNPLSDCRISERLSSDELKSRSEQRNGTINSFESKNEFQLGRNLSFSRAGNEQFSKRTAAPRVVEQSSSISLKQKGKKKGRKETRRNGSRGTVESVWQRNAHSPGKWHSNNVPPFVGKKLAMKRRQGFVDRKIWFIRYKRSRKLLLYKL